jgi:hypothetical protein
MLIVIVKEEGYSSNHSDTITFECPIRDTKDDTHMRNISPSTLHIFNGFSSEDRDNFTFEFDVLCKTYDYTKNAHKMKLFLTTLKNLTL